MVEIKIVGAVALAVGMSAGLMFPIVRKVFGNPSALGYALVALLGTLAGVLAIFLG